MSDKEILNFISVLDKKYINKFNNPVSFETFKSDTLIRIFKYKDKQNFESDLKLKTWIEKIYYNRYLTVLESKKLNIKTEQINAISSPVSFDNIETDIISKDAIKELQTALNKLKNHRQRESIKLFYLDGLRYEEISERLNITAKSSKSAVYLALKELRKNNALKFA